MTTILLADLVWEKAGDFQNTTIPGTSDYATGVWVRENLTTASHLASAHQLARARLDCTPNLLVGRCVDRDRRGHVASTVEVRGHSHVSSFSELTAHREESGIKEYFIAFLVSGIDQHQ